MVEIDHALQMWKSTAWCGTGLQKFIALLKMFVLDVTHNLTEFSFCYPVFNSSHFASSNIFAVAVVLFLEREMGNLQNVGVYDLLEDRILFRKVGHLQ